MKSQHREYPSLTLIYTIDILMLSLHYAFTFSEWKCKLTGYVLPVLAFTSSEEFHSRMTLQLLRALEHVAESEDTFSPEVLAMLSLLQTVQCNYEQRLFTAFKADNDNCKWHIEGGLD